MPTGLIVVTISQYVCTSKHQVVNTKYIQFLFLNYISIKLNCKTHKKIETGKVGECNEQEKEKKEKKRRRRGRRKRRETIYTGNSEPTTKTYSKQLEGRDYR